ncbi:LINC01173 isoform 1 [Pan troglodytes]|uniref:LINC01173 isoform 1 n=1 Tax=Pan troglodytes TaxID=9598 RepID=A0A2J8NEL8_PANTR|nr:LINC01173 isoform 1 [Pan troglodytes]
MPTLSPKRKNYLRFPKACSFDKKAGVFGGERRVRLSVDPETLIYSKTHGDKDINISSIHLMRKKSFDKET